MLHIILKGVLQRFIFHSIFSKIVPFRKFRSEFHEMDPFSPFLEILMRTKLLKSRQGVSLASRRIRKHNFFCEIFRFHSSKAAIMNFAKYIIAHILAKLDNQPKKSPVHMVFEVGNHSKHHINFSPNTISKYPRHRYQGTTI